MQGKYAHAYQQLIINNYNTDLLKLFYSDILAQTISSLAQVPTKRPKNIMRGGTIVGN